MQMQIIQEIPMENNNPLIELVDNKTVLSETVFADVNINETSKTKSNMAELIEPENTPLQG